MSAPRPGVKPHAAPLDSSNTLPAEWANRQSRFPRAATDRRINPRIAIGAQQADRQTVDHQDNGRFGGRFARHEQQKS
jgi:hypothetical protein